MRLRYIAPVAVAAAVLGLVGSAAASGPSAVINACRNGDFNVRLVDDPASCRPSEIAVSWDQAGPQGDPGPAGPAGPAGAPGVSSLHSTVVTVDGPTTTPDSGAQFTVTATCPAGFFAVDGTTKLIIPAPANLTWQHIEDESKSFGHPTADGAGWTGIVQYNTSGFTATPEATVYCLGPGI